MRALLNERSRDRSVALKALASSLRRLLTAFSGAGARLVVSALADGDSGLKVVHAVTDRDSTKLSTAAAELKGFELSAAPHDSLLAELGARADGLSVVMGSAVLVGAGGFIAILGDEAGPSSEERLGQSLENLASCMSRALRTEKQPLDEIERAYLLARLARLRFERLDDQRTLDPVLLRSLGAERISAAGIVPLRAEPEGLVVALADPLDAENLRAFELATGRQVRTRIVVPRSDVDRVVLQLKGLSYDQGVRSAVFQQYRHDPAGEQVELPESEAPITRLVVELVGRAYLSGASDIHIEPQRDALMIRFRIDGICRVVDRLPLNAHAALINRFKIMAELDIAEHRVPQDGRVVFRRYCPEMDIGLRVAIAPMSFGECAVIRIIDRSGVTLPLDQLGFSSHGLAIYRGWLERPHGMIIHAGPTGSGKSISLFAALASLNSPQIKIVTAEDPIEYSLDGINQLEIRPKAGLTFSRALRSFVRLDPDVILLGEMRDQETASAAFGASLAGPRLLTTLHANDSLAALPRLRQLGVDTYHIAYALRGICAQRLLRKLCICRREVSASDEERAHLLRFGYDGAALVYAPGACELCDFTGYKGRIGAYELLTCSGEIQRLIAQNADLSEIDRAIQKTDFCSLTEAALAHVVSGRSSFEEVRRVVGFH